MSGWQRTPKSIRCRPSVQVEAGTCRRRTFGGATQANLDAYVAAGLSITIPIPQLETEALFYTPFSFSASVLKKELELLKANIFSGRVQLHWASDRGAGKEHPGENNDLHQARDGWQSFFSNTR